VENILAEALGQDATQLAAAEKRDLLARMLARLAHEIRNPLSSLDIHVQLLEEDLGRLAPEMPEPLASRLVIIRGELHRLENIVENFLKLAGPSSLDIEPVAIETIIMHVCELLRPEGEARGIQISALIAGSLPQIPADLVRLTQALLNLVINALQAIGRNGRIEVEASLVTTGDAMSIEVRDTGPGIPSEKLASIFEPYFTTKAEGSGLGLWIAQQIVTAHGGSLKARNGPAGGAVFTMVLPLKRKEQPGG
jgi:two-component system sensor histidine kinase HydH